MKFKQLKRRIPTSENIYKEVIAIDGYGKKKDKIVLFFKIKGKEFSQVLFDGIYCRGIIILLNKRLTLSPDMIWKAIEKIEKKEPKRIISNPVFIRNAVNEELTKFMMGKGLTFYCPSVQPL